MKCPHCGRELGALCQALCGPWFEPEMDLDAAARSLKHDQRVSIEFWRECATRRAKTRVARAGFKAAARAAKKAGKQ